MSYEVTNPTDLLAVQKAFGVKNQILKSAVNGARGNNRFINTVSAASANVASPSSAPSTTGYTNQTAFVNITATSTANSNILTGVSSIAGLAIGRPVMEIVTNALAPLTIPLGAVITEIGTTTITLDRPAMLSTNAFSIRTCSEKLSFPGGVAALYGSNLRPASALAGNSVNPPTARAIFGATTSIEIMTDAAIFQSSDAGLMFQFFRNGNSSPKFRVAINDVYLTPDQVSFDATLDFVTIQFTNAIVHKVRIETAGNTCISAVWTKNGATIWKPTPKPIIGFFGDSWFANAAFTRNNPAMIASAILGTDSLLCSVGGTGYVNDGGTNYNWASDFRGPELLWRNLDAIVIHGTVNDGVSSTIQANALATWQKIRAIYPKVPIHIFGAPTTNAFSAGNATTAENYLKAAFATWADKNSFFHGLTTDTGGALFNSNNLATVMITSDNHLIQGVGTELYGQWMATKIAEDWNI